MLLNLIDLNKSVPSHIFKRGKSYFQNGKVKHIKQSKSNTTKFHAEVLGTEIYLVQLEVNNQLDILSSNCECPYTQTDFCKHQVALCLAIHNSVSDLPTQVESMVSSIPTVRYEDVLDKDEQRRAKIYVQSSINSAKQRGFISYSQSFRALDGAEKVILLIDQYIETSRYQMSVMIGLQTLQPVVNALKFTDDSSGNFGVVIQQLLSQIHYSISCGAFSWSSPVKTSMLKQIIKASENKVYTDWSDWKFELLRSGMPICEDEKLFNLMSLHLQFLETSLQSKSGNMSRFEISQLKILQFNLLSVRQDNLAIDKFLKENRHLDDIKEIAFERAIALQKLDEAMDIALAGEVEHSEYPGLANKWRIHQYKLHKIQNHVSHQKELAFQLVSHGNIEFFNDLKELYSLNEWPDVLNNLLSILINKHRYSEVYTIILKQEKLYSQLLLYCKGNLHDLPEHAQWLHTEHPQETKDLYLQWLYEKASSASNRSKYRQVCREIKSFKNLFGKEDTAILVDSLQKKYPLRIAFLDELDKMK